MKRSTSTLLSVILVAVLAVAAAAGDDKPALDPAAQQAMMQAWAPGEHHAHMKKLVGNFDYTIKMWMDPSQPPSESTGKRSAEMVLGDRYLVETYTGTFMGMPFEGRGTMAYDNLQKHYVSTWIDNMGTGIMIANGACDGKGTWNMSGESPDPMTGKMIKTRSVMKLVDDNTFVMEMYMPGADGKETKMMEITGKRAM
jgi:hypothetical protein